MDSLKKRIVALYNANHRTGIFDGKKYDYTCPSPTFYPFQWLWDSCFHAIALSHFDITRAKREIETLLSTQRENGFIPCVSFWDKKLSILKLFYITETTQPPVIPISVQVIYKSSRDKIFLRKVYPKLKLFLNWFVNERGDKTTGLVKIIHPWESGIDATPSFDKQLGIKKINPSFLNVMSKYAYLAARYYLLGWNVKKIVDKNLFVSEELLFNSIYAKSLKIMAVFAKELGYSEDRKWFEKTYNQVRDSILNKYWSDKDRIFYNLDSEGKQIKIKTISSLAPLILDDLPKKYMDGLISHLTNKEEFWSKYPVPSVAMDEKTFDPNVKLVLWRGTVWLSTNWFLFKALAKKGHKMEAERIKEGTIAMVEKSGFREHFNPLTGEGHGQKNFTWPGLIIDMVD